MNKTPQDTSYEMHSAMESNLTNVPTCYTDPNSVDAWRHRRMLDFILPLLSEHPNARWMTVGDGRYASDAYYLSQHGADVVATSLSDATLLHAYKMNYIQSYRVENAENITSLDEEYDYVLCKESYHHFPRPPIAFYEMLRVSKKAVILIEPYEGTPKLFDSVKTIIKSILRKHNNHHYEPSGNYIYRMNIAEISKMMTALDYRCIAIRLFNDFFHPKLSAGRCKTSIQYLVTRLGIGVLDIFCGLRLMNYGLAVTITFKDTPSDRLVYELMKLGYNICTLPKNPYSPNGERS